MKKYFLILAIIIVVALIAQPVSAAKPTPTVTITLLNPPAGSLLELAVGELYTFDVQVTSSEPFILAMALPDPYYPGRGANWRLSDNKSGQATSALLHLTVTAKKSTADLLPVCDWPEPGMCWEAGIAPQVIVTGVRFKNGVVLSEAFPFAILVK